MNGFHGQYNRINIDWLTQMYIWWLFGMLSMVKTTASILIGSLKYIFGDYFECCPWSIQPHQYWWANSTVYLLAIWNVCRWSIHGRVHLITHNVYTHQCELWFCHESCLRTSEKYNLRRDINAQAMSVNTINVALHILTKLLGRKWGDFNERSELQKI